MNRNRPTVVLVMGILNIIFGGIGLLCGLCGVLTTVFKDSLGKMLAGIPGAGQSIEAQQQMMEREIPNFTAIQTTSQVVTLLFAVILLLGGLGLVFVRKWGRWCCLFYALTMPVIQIANLYWTITQVNPVAIKAQVESQAEMMKKMNQPNPMPQDTSLMVMAANVMAGLMVGIVVIYCLILLVTMLLPSVSRAFAGPSANTSQPEEYYDAPPGS
jgi:hypothetical protein